MSRRGRPRTGGRRYRQVAEQEYGILMCNSPVGCKKAFSMTAHRRGKIDNAGVIHWLRADAWPRRRGIYPFLKMIGWALHDREWEKLPRWLRIYTQAAWAIKEGKSRFHTQFKVEENWRDREAVLRAGAGHHLRTTHFTAYLWARRVYTLRNK